MTKESYLEKAEKFIKIDDLTGNTIMETLARGIKMFAKWLDSEEKSEAKKDLETRIKRIEDWIDFWEWDKNAEK